jgi:hypothetical protein
MGDKEGSSAQMNQTSQRLLPTLRSYKSGFSVTSAFPCHVQLDSLDLVGVRRKGVTR